MSRIIYANGVFMILESGNMEVGDARPEVQELVRPMVVNMTGYYPEALVGTKIARLVK